MISADQLHKADVRMRQAKMKPQVKFGGLALNLCGDFMQLPPVDKDGSKKSLAMPFDDMGRCCDEDDTTAIDAKRKEAKEARMLESRQGFELWRSFHGVVCLSINVRAPGVLSRLQSEMRAGRISDEMWDLYVSRVVTPNDPRLSDPSSPFCRHDIQFIVHRHKIRVMRSLAHAKDQSRKKNSIVHCAGS